MLASPPTIVAVTDPNWLLSSTAQSAAALVAIVGGFLVSRLITLSGERNAIVHRYDDLRGMRVIKQAEYDEVHADRLAVSTEWFVEHHKDELLANRGNVEVSRLLDWIPRGSSEEEMREIATSLPDAFEKAYEDIEQKFPGMQPFAWAVDALRASGLIVPPESESIYQMVAESIANDRSMMPAFRTIIPTTDIMYRRQDARIDLERQLNSELRALDAELNLVGLRLQAFRKPEGVIGAVMALTYLALVGVALPTTLMAWRPVPDGPAVRTLVVVAFVSGLAVLLAYFIFRARSLRIPESTN